MICLINKLKFYIKFNFIKFNFLNFIIKKKLKLKKKGKIKLLFTKL